MPNNSEGYQRLKWQQAWRHEVLRAASKEIETVYAESGLEGLLALLVDETRHGTRDAILWHPAVPTSVHILLSYHTDLFVRLSVAACPRTPQAVLRRLANDSLSVACLVAANPNTPKDALEYLAMLKVPAIRAIIKDNPNTPKKLKVLLSLE